jgi:hypothetical protein
VVWVETIEIYPALPDLNDAVTANVTYVEPFKLGVAQTYTATSVHLKYIIHILAQLMSFIGIDNYGIVPLFHLVLSIRFIFALFLNRQ